MMDREETFRRLYQGEFPLDNPSPKLQAMLHYELVISNLEYRYGNKKMKKFIQSMTEKVMRLYDVDMSFIEKSREAEKIINSLKASRIVEHYKLKMS